MGDRTLASYTYTTDGRNLLSALDYGNGDQVNYEYDTHDRLIQDWGEDRDFIEEYLGQDTIVKSVYAFNENVLEFSCGGFGLATGSTYVGFYFSKDDTPFAWNLMDVSSRNWSLGFLNGKMRMERINFIQKE